MISSKLSTQYFILASIIILACCLLILASYLSVESFEVRLRNLSASTIDDTDQKGPDTLVPHYYSEVAMACIFFCFIGGCISATAYIESYIRQTA